MTATTRLFITTGALGCMAGVITGAFGAHALEQALSPDRLQTWGKGVDYLQLERQQAALQESFTEDLLDSLGPVSANHQDPFLKSYGTLIPQSCRSDGSARLARAIEETPALHPLLDEALRVAQQENERCLRISQRLAAGGRGA